MFIYSRNFGRKALPDAKALRPARLTPCRPPNLAQGRRCARLRRVRLCGASQLMEMDGGCGAQRPLWRAFTSVVLLLTTASDTAATAAAPAGRRRRRGATARDRCRLRLLPPPPQNARRRQRCAAATHRWLGTPGSPLLPHTADPTAPLHPAGGPPPP